MNRDARSETPLSRWKPSVRPSAMIWKYWIDVHTRLDPADSLDFCNKVAQYNPFFIEDPLGQRTPPVSDGFDSRPRYRLPSVNNSIANGRSEKSSKKKLMDYCRVDLCIAGGLTEARKIAGWCETHYIYIAPHTHWDRYPLQRVCTSVCHRHWSACRNSHAPRCPHSRMLFRCRCRGNQATSYHQNVQDSALNLTKTHSPTSQRKNTDRLTATNATTVPTRIGNPKSSIITIGNHRLSAIGNLQFNMWHTSMYNRHTPFLLTTDG